REPRPPSRPGRGSSLYGNRRLARRARPYGSLGHLPSDDTWGYGERCSRDPKRGQTVTLTLVAGLGRLSPRHRQRGADVGPGVPTPDTGEGRQLSGNHVARRVASVVAAIALATALPLPVSVGAISAESTSG